MDVIEFRLMVYSPHDKLATNAFVDENFSSSLANLDLNEDEFLNGQLCFQLERSHYNWVKYINIEYALQLEWEKNLYELCFYKYTTSPDIVLSSRLKHYRIRKPNPKNPEVYKLVKALDHGVYAAPKATQPPYPPPVMFKAFPDALPAYRYENEPLLQKPISVPRKKYPCECIKERSTFDCSICFDEWQCADTTIIYAPKNRDYGIPVRDGGSSYIKIDYCPWCGTKLNNRKAQGPVRKIVV